jgi:uncharacterized membrane protein YhaH (DUF805 family)
MKFISNLFSFEGRIKKTEYAFSFIVAIFFLYLIGDIIEIKGTGFVALFYIPTYWLLFAQGAKRCHDLGKNGWYQLIPFYVLLLIFTDGEIGLNRYGANPMA